MRRRKTQELAPKTPDGDLSLETVQRWLKASVGTRNQWREEAEKAYDFVAGEQWTPEEKQVMEDLRRPVTVFNRIAPIVDAIVGHETANRQAIAYLPRQIGATAVAETISAAARWVRDECGADGEESDAFQDCVITGEGWTGTEPNYDDDPDGMIETERVDPREMDIDPACEKKNYKGAKWLCRTRRMDLESAQEKWPKGEFEPADRRSKSSPINVIEAAFYHSDSGKEGRHGAETNQVLIHDFQWWEYEDVYRFPSQNLPPELVQALGSMENGPKPSETGMLTFDAEQWAVIKKAVPLAEPVKQRRKIYKRMFWSGDEVLERKDCPTKDSFTYKAITAKRDRKKRMWYGIVRAMRDPQLWSNKFMSLALEIISTSAKGGPLVEIDAVEDARRFEDDWADPSQAVYVKPGSIAGKKIMPRADFANKAPPGMQELMMYANQSLHDAAGVNPAVMGFSKELDVSGVLEQTRLQAGLNLLSYLFDSLRRYRKEQGVLMMAMIREFIPQGRLVKIEGPEGAQYVPLAFNPTIMKYDIVVDEAPTAPNVKEQTWASFTAIAKFLPPAMMTPEFILPLLKYSPFPSALVQEWTKAAMNPKAQADAAKAKQLQEASVASEIQERQAKANLDNAKAQHEGQSDPLEIQGELVKQQTERIKAAAEIKAAEAKAHQTHLETRSAVLHHHLDTQAALRDAALAEREAQLKTPQGTP